MEVIRREEDIACEECGRIYLATFEIIIARLQMFLCLSCIMKLFKEFKPHINI